MNQTSYRTKWIIGGFVCMYGLGIQPLVPQVKAAPVEAASVDQRLREALSRPAVEGLALSPVSLRAAMTLQRLLTQPDFSLPADLPEAELTYALTFHRELLRDRSLTLAAPAPDRPSGGRTTAQVRTELAKLWLARHGEALAAEALTTEALAAEALTTEDTGRPLVQSLATNARLLLGDYLSSQQDGRCVPLYRACFEQWEREHTDGGGVIQKINGSVPGMHPLAWYYQARGEWKAAAQAYLRSEKYSTSHVWVASALVEAARAYNKCGETAAAQMTYAKVANYSKGGWATGMAARDQSAFLIAKGQFVEAANLMLADLKDQDDPQIKVILLASIGECFYRAGDRGKAKAYAQQAIDQYQLLKSPPQNVGFDGPIGEARSMMRWCEIWERTPIVVLTPPHLEWNPSVDNPDWLETRVRTRTPREGVLQTSSNNDLVKVSAQGTAKNLGFFWEQEFSVRVPAKAYQQGLAAEINFKDSVPEAGSIQWPLELSRQKKLTTSASTVFFGEINSNETRVETITLKAGAPFGIHRITADNESLQVQQTSPRLASEHTIQVSLAPKQAVGFVEGTIQINTDVPAEEVAIIHYYARVK